MSNLRELKVQIDLVDNISNELLSVNSELDNMESVVGEVEHGVSDLGHETKTYGHESKSVLEGLNVNWAMVGGAIAGAGIALEMFARSQQDLLFESERIAYSLNMQGSEVRALAREYTDATLSIGDFYGVMRIGTKQGLREGTDDLIQYIQFWDMVSDATGEPAPGLARTGRALQSVGIDAANVTESQAALGYVFQETTMEVSEFLNLIEYASGDLMNLDMGLEETAALLSLMESELGLYGRKLRTEFSQATREADGDLGALLDNLGLTEDQLIDTTAAVRESGPVLSDLADKFKESRTAAQEMQASLAGFTHEYGAHFMPIIEMLAPALTGIGTVIGVLAGVKYLWPTFIGILKGIAAAVTFIAGAIGAVPAIIAAAVASSVLFWLNVEKIWGWVTDLFTDDGWLADSPLGKLVAQWDDVIAYLKSIDLFDIGKNIIASLISGFENMKSHVSSSIKGIGESISTGFKDFFGMESPSKLMLEYGTNIMSGLDIGMKRSAPAGIPTPALSFAGGGGSYAPTVNISIEGFGGSAEELAEKIDRRLRAIFSSHADKYFAAQRRRRPRKREEEVHS